MENMGYFFAAYTVIWAFVFVYIFLMRRKQKGLQRQIDMLRESVEKAQEGN